MAFNILVLSHFAGSPKHGMVIRNYLLSREWARAGHDVTIFASDYSHYRSVQPDNKGWMMTEHMEGVRFVWVRGLTYSAESSLGRVAAMAWFTAQCYLHGIRDHRRYDVVIASSPHPFVIYPAASIAKRDNAYLVYDIRDLWPLTPIYLGGHSPKHPFIRALQHAEDYACRHADLVIAVQQNAEGYLRDRGLEEGRFLHVANGYSGLDYSSGDSTLPTDIHAELDDVRNSGAFLVGYCGALGTANAMRLLIEALAHTPTHVHVAIIGGGPEKARLIAAANEYFVGDRVHIFDAIPRSSVSAFLEQVDVAYVGGHPSPLYKYGASVTKLNDYFSAGKPVVYGLGDPDNPVRVSGAGIEYEPGCVASLAKALIEIANLSPSQRACMGEKGRNWLKEHRRMDSISKKFWRS